MTRAGQRLAGLVSINEELDLGHNLTVVKYGEQIAATGKLLANYNKLLSDTDDAGAALDKAETKLADLSDLMLKGVATKFGTDSAEYRKAGGTPKSEIKRGRKAKALKAA